MLSKILKETILKNGAISFRDFMASALYHPEYGYYTSGIAEIGHKGDFYTSPSLHPIFGVVIAKQIEQMWEVMEMPKIFDIVEFGSGVGYLANDILNSISGQFRDSLRYNVIEVNPKSIQTLSRNLSSKIRIIKDISELNNIEGCILSNELIDAQPVQIVEMVNGSLREIYLDSELKEVYRDCSSEIIEYIKEFAPDLPDNYRTEVNLELRRWINDVYRVLSKGFVLTIDYGYTAREYYDVERGRGTLVCYHKHSVNENPYINIGTVLADNPSFTARIRGGIDPIRIIIDPDLKTPDGFNVLKTPPPTIIVCKDGNPRSSILINNGIEILTYKDKLDLNWLMEELGKRQIMSILIEGGSTLAGHALEESIVDKVMFFIAPKIIRGKDSLTAIGGETFQKINEAHQ
ncbi:MAG: SAM-dependent methyltransferase, partial [Nitrospirae bacterium]|nr:SAM-dependent methyltransferase [Nitrospirota bacterium]